MATCQACVKQIPEGVSHCPYCGVQQQAQPTAEKKTMFGYAPSPAELQQMQQQAKAGQAAPHHGTPGVPPPAAVPTQASAPQWQPPQPSAPPPSAPAPFAPPPQQAAPPFGQPPQQAASPFGQPQQPAPFGGPPPQQPPAPFAPPPQQAAPFGQPPQPSGPFGQPQQASQPFGQQPPAPADPYGATMASSGGAPPMQAPDGTPPTMTPYGAPAGAPPTHPPTMAAYAPAPGAPATGALPMGAPPMGAPPMGAPPTGAPPMGAPPGPAPSFTPQGGMPGAPVAGAAVAGAAVAGAAGDAPKKEKKGAGVAAAAAGEFKLSKIIPRVVKLFSDPRGFWQATAGEGGGVGPLLPSVIVFASIAAVATALGMLIATGSVLVLILQLVVGAIVNVGLWFLLSILINAFAKTFGGAAGMEGATKIAFGVMLPGWVAAVLNIIPVSIIRMIVMLAAFGYGCFLLYLGVQEVNATPKEKAIGYTATVMAIYIVSAFVVMAIVGVIVGLVTAGAMVAAAS